MKTEAQNVLSVKQNITWMSNRIPILRIVYLFKYYFPCFLKTFDLDFILFHYRYTYIDDKGIIIIELGMFNFFIYFIFNFSYWLCFWCNFHPSLISIEPKWTFFQRTKILFHMMLDTCYNKTYSVFKNKRYKETYAKKQNLTANTLHTVNQIDNKQTNSFRILRIRRLL